MFKEFLLGVLGVVFVVCILFHLFVTVFWEWLKFKINCLKQEQPTNKWL